MSGTESVFNASANNHEKRAGKTPLSSPWHLHFDVKGTYGSPITPAAGRKIELKRSGLMPTSPPPSSPSPNGIQTGARRLFQPTHEDSGEIHSFADSAQCSSAQCSSSQSSSTRSPALDRGYDTPSRLEVTSRVFGTARRLNPEHSQMVTPVRAVMPERARDPEVKREYLRLPTAEAARGVMLIARQHGLESTRTMLKYFKNRLHIKNIFFADKGYSTSNSSWEKIRKFLGPSRVMRFPMPPQSSRIRLQKFYQDQDGRVHLKIKIRKKIYGPWCYAKVFQRHLDRQFGWPIWLWEHGYIKKPKKIIYLNDGGRMPSKRIMQKLQGIALYIVEQTTAGEEMLLRNPPCAPFISIARSKMKQNEDQFIGLTNRPRLIKIIKSTGVKKIGFKGLGRIGINSAKFLIEELLHSGYEFFYYEPADCRARVQREIINLGLNGKIHACETVEQLIGLSEFILGSTGKDTLKDVKLQQAVKGNIILGSTSSECVEFKTPMAQNRHRIINWDEYKKNPFCTLIEKLEGGQLIKYFYGTYPLTFMDLETGQPDSDPTPLRYIGNTRTALALAVYQWMQAETLDSDRDRNVLHPTFEPLEEDLQRFGTREFIASLPETDEAKAAVVANSKRLGLIPSTPERSSNPLAAVPAVAKAERGARSPLRSSFRRGLSPMDETQVKAELGNHKPQLSQLRARVAAAIKCVRKTAENSAVSKAAGQSSASFFYRTAGQRSLASDNLVQASSAQGWPMVSSSALAVGQTNVCDSDAQSSQLNRSIFAT